MHRRINYMENFEYSDVTLLSRDDQKLEAHRVILSAPSDFFKDYGGGE